MGIDRNVPAQKVKVWHAAAVIVLIAVFYFSTLRQADGWADFSQYLGHAKNIAAGAPYAETGYIYNPSYSTLGPATYPPVFPLLLAPVYRVFPDRLTPLRIEMIFLTLLAFWMLFLNFRRLLPLRYSILALLCIGFSPAYWEVKEKILSDMPFLLFIFLALFLIHKWHSKNVHRWWECVGTGMALYLAYGTRSIGIALVVSLLVYDLIRNRKPSSYAVLSVLVFFGLAALQMIYFPGADYSERVTRISISSVLSNVAVYGQYASYFWDNGYSKVALHFVSAIVFLLSATGLYLRLRERITIYEVFATLLAMVLAFYPGHHHRYLFPLIPLCLLYAFFAIYKMKELTEFKYENIAVTVLMALIFTSYVTKYTTLQFESPPEGVHKAESVQLFRFVREQTLKTDVMIFRRPRALAFYTGRKASAYHQTQPAEDAELWRYFRSIDASYLIESYFDVPYFRSFVLRNNFKLQKVFSNRDFNVYKIQ